MSEQDVLGRLAAANPVRPDEVRGAETSSRAMFLLRSVLAGDRTRRIRWRLALALAVPAAAVLAAVVIAGTVPGVPATPAPTAGPATPRTILIAAAEHAANAHRQGAFVHVTGTVGQVLSVRSAGGYHVVRVDVVQSMYPAAGQPGEGWLTLGEAGTSVRPLTGADAPAWERDGSPGADRLPPGTLDPDLAGDPRFPGSVAGLPDDPARTGAAMLDGVLTPDPQGWLFRQGTKLLDTFTDVVTGADRAKIYRMLAGLTGVRALATPTDPLGRPATGLAYTASTPRHGTVEWQVYIGAGTDQIRYRQAIVREPGAVDPGLSPGTVWHSAAVTSVTWTDKP